MAKAKTIYTCQHCGAQSPKWLGKCPDCNEWNSYVEETYQQSSFSAPHTTKSKPKPLNEIDATGGNHIPIGIAELDRVLGGGYVPGSAILIGGDPGIGKSTLILQTLGHLAAKGKKILYISGEESAAQIKSRSERLSVAPANLFILTENNLEIILENLKKEKWDLVAIDSIQTIYSSNLNSSPGTVSQVREAAGGLITHTKKTETACWLVGHVTKEGNLAGPKVLEHMVDGVFYFESDQGHAFRILRAVKNRFGPANEIGVFEMTSTGLKEVANPSHLFLSERSEKVAGSVVVASLEGTRPLLLEIQALVSHSGFGNPRRTSIGVDSARLALLAAVLEKIVGVHLSDQDIFVNVAGGLRIIEPAIDLGVATAIYSSFRNAPCDPQTILIGETGLTGEVRAVSLIEARLKEAAKLGFQHAIIPKGNAPKESFKGLKISVVKTVEECLGLLF